MFHFFTKRKIVFLISKFLFFLEPCLHIRGKQQSERSFISFPWFKRGYTERIEGFINFKTHYDSGIHQKIAQNFVPEFLQSLRFQVLFSVLITVETLFFFIVVDATKQCTLNNYIHVKGNLHSYYRISLNRTKLLINKFVRKLSLKKCLYQEK